MRLYRFLLREPPPDAVEVAHREALERLGPDDRQAILEAVQGGLVAGQRLRPGDTAQLAHLIVLGERHMPDAFLDACEPTTLKVLAEAVTDSEACFGLFGGYVAWDAGEARP